MNYGSTERWHNMAKGILLLDYLPTRCCDCILRNDVSIVKNNMSHYFKRFNGWWIFQNKTSMVSFKRMAKQIIDDIIKNKVPGKPGTFIFLFIWHIHNETIEYRRKLVRHESRRSIYADSSKKYGARI